MTKARIISFLIVVCLATTCMLSGTVAKYTTSDSATDSATVGKWGVTLGIDGSLFGEKYDALSDPAETADDQPTTGTSISVASDKANDNNVKKNVVAPGTKNDTGMTITLTGTPEVSTTVTVDVNNGTLKDVYLAAGTYAILTPINADSVTEVNFVTNKYYTIGNDNVLVAIANWDAFGTAKSASTEIYVIDDVRATIATGGYNPIRYSIDYTTETDLTDATLAKMVATLEALSVNANNATTQSYAPNTNLGDISALNGAKITWAWAFGTGANDAADTILGALIAGQKVVKIDTVSTGEGETVTTTTTYTVLSVDNDSGAVTAGTDENSVVGCLKTNFEITITVDQVD